MIQTFVYKNFKPESLRLISHANQTIEKFQEDGFMLTVRQLYYQLVKANIIPNAERSYQNLINLVSDARLAGLVDWAAIEDRTRRLSRRPSWGNVFDYATKSCAWYHEDRWKLHDTRVEVWVEKEALAEVIDIACSPLDVPWFACRGYASQTSLYDAGKRVHGYYENGQSVEIIHLGDHDPSGLDMSRDIVDRLNMFAPYATINFHRIALNMDQIEELNPPPNPAKFTDSRAKEYVRKFGTSSWELDAIPPKDMVELIQSKINEFVDADKWIKVEKSEEKNRRKLEKVVKKNREALE